LEKEDVEDFVENFVVVDVIEVDFFVVVEVEVELEFVVVEPFVVEVVEKLESVEIGKDGVEIEVENDIVEIVVVDY